MFVSRLCQTIEAKPELLGTHRIAIRILNSVQYALLKLFVNMY